MKPSCGKWLKEAMWRNEADMRAMVESN